MWIFMAKMIVYSFFTKKMEQIMNIFNNVTQLGFIFCCIHTQMLCSSAYCTVQQSQVKCLRWK